jgi:hypothetical protein
MLLVLCSEAEFVTWASSVMISEAFEVLLKEAEIIFKLKKDPKIKLLPIPSNYRILSSIVHTFLHWKGCWNIPCALYMEGSWERFYYSFYDE